MQRTGAYVGRQFKLIREERNQTQEQASEFLKDHGISWSQARISQFEAGKARNISFNALVLLSLAYQVPLVFWFEGKEVIELTSGPISETVKITTRDLRHMLCGEI